MIPILYNEAERMFRSGGIGSLADIVSCTVTEERNGVYEAEFVYPITGRHYEDLQERRIIIATHDDTQTVQPFEIYARSAPINGLVTFYAHHISYKLSNAVVMPFTAVSCADAMAKIDANIVNENSFTFWTDKAVNGDFVLSQPKTVRPVLGGEEGSLLDIYGKGDYEFDFFQVKLHTNRGIHTDVEIRYGKNLSDIKHDTDLSSTYNAIVPYWVNQETGAVLTLPEGYLIRPDADFYETDLTDEGLDILRDENGAPIQVRTAPVVAIPFPMNDYFETQPTENEMRTLAQGLLDSSDSWAPHETIKVDFVQLWQTEEYEQYAPLQRVRLCDTVRVYYPELGVVADQEKVVKTVYNTLLDRYDEIELNQLPTTLAQLTTNQIHAETSGTVTPESVRNQINLAIALIRGGLGGYIAIPADIDGLSDSVLILDQPSTSTAVNVLRLNQNGLSHSGNGVNGTYSTIINMSGEVMSINGANMVKLGAGALSVLLNNGIINQLVAMTINTEAVSGFKATNAFVLADAAGVLGYRYSGSAGNGSYGVPHYFVGDVHITGNLTVTGTINGN